MTPSPVWREIESAPEGVWVLVADRREAVNGLRLYVARKESWDYEGLSGVSFEGPYSDGYLCDLADISVEPTHWMPLPPPPTQEQTDDPIP
jgi:hypothetical protein